MYKKECCNCKHYANWGIYSGDCLLKDWQVCDWNSCKYWEERKI